MAAGFWLLASDFWLLANGHYNPDLMATGCWLLASDFWLLANGHYNPDLMATGCWLLWYIVNLKPYDHMLSISSIVLTPPSLMFSNIDIGLLNFLLNDRTGKPMMETHDVANRRLGGPTLDDNPMQPPYKTNPSHARKSPLKRSISGNIYLLNNAHLFMVFLPCYGLYYLKSNKSRLRQILITSSPWSRVTHLLFVWEKKSRLRRRDLQLEDRIG
jgi:hypothetical protein